MSDIQDEESSRKARLVLDPSRESSTSFDSYGQAFKKVQDLIWNQTKDQKALDEVRSWETQYGSMEQAIEKKAATPEYLIPAILHKITDPELKSQIIQVLFNTSKRTGRYDQALCVLVKGRVGDLNSTDNWSERYEDTYRLCLENQGFKFARLAVGLITDEKRNPNIGLSSQERTTKWETRSQRLYAMDGLGVVQDFMDSLKHYGAKSYNIQDYFSLPLSEKIRDFARYMVNHPKEVQKEVDYEKVAKDLIRYYALDPFQGYFHHQSVVTDEKESGIDSAGLGLLRRYAKDHNLNLATLSEAEAKELFGKDSYDDYVENRNKLATYSSSALN